MNKLDTAKRARVIAALVEGTSVNATVRMTGVSKVTILKLLKDLGTACAAFHDDAVRGLNPRNVECDEVWSFCYAKQRNVPDSMKGTFGVGDIWLWTAIDADNKLMIAWRAGLRTPVDAREFMLDLAGRVNSIDQLTTDGLGAYPPAVREAFGDEVNYAQLVKIYGSEISLSGSRYSPPVCLGSRKESLIGAPDPARVCTSHIERSNLTLRMSNRRYTRLTNAFSKSAANHVHSIALFMVHYNFCRAHKSLGGKTPAMVAGLADHAWSLDELVGLLN